MMQHEVKMEDSGRMEGNVLCSEDVEFGSESSGKDPDLCSIMAGAEDSKEHVRGGQVGNGGHAADVVPLFDDTLDLSHDGIQKTLTANLVSSRRRPSSDSSSGGVLVKTENIGNGPTDTDPVDLNPMDFIDNDISTPDEEVFNLDTFDMLTDLPNWDDFNSDLSATTPGGVGVLSCSSGLGGSSLSVVHTKNPTTQSSHSGMTYREGTANITDYSPDWSYTEVGARGTISSNFAVV